MAGRHVPRRQVVERVQVPGVDDPSTQRAFDVLKDAVADLQARPQRVPVSASLVVGTNKVKHGLGRALTGYHLTPMSTVAFTHALDKTNPRPDLEVWITVAGNSVTCILEVF